MILPQAQRTIEEEEKAKTVARQKAEAVKKAELRAKSLVRMQKSKVSSTTEQRVSLRQEVEDLSCSCSCRRPAASAAASAVRNASREFGGLGIF